MGQKINPVCFRLKTIRSWDSIWYSPIRDMGKHLVEDEKIRRFLYKELASGGISKIGINRNRSNVYVDVYTAKPGVVIGRQGAQIDKLKTYLDKKFGRTFELNVKEIKKPDLEAAIVADNVARAIEKRVAYRRVIKQSIAKAMEAGAQGIKIYVGGRLNGADIARGEYYKEGNIPLHTIRTDISYAIDRSNTTYGVIGIKVWIYRGEVFK